MVQGDRDRLESMTTADTERTSLVFVIKAEVRDLRTKAFTFSAQKTMYGGKHIAKGDTVFVFASENEGGQGLIARGMVTSAKAVAKKHGVARQTPRVTITVERITLAKRPLGRGQLKQYTDWDDGRPETELNFKFYRQATNKVGGISDESAAFLDGFF
jgi:ribosomal protein L24